MNTFLLIFLKRSNACHFLAKTQLPAGMSCFYLFFAAGYNKQERENA